jgi:hypothetical protein
MSVKTYAPALGTVLLARATDARIDPFSIKAEYGENTYSLRTLCHEVLVPAAREFGFSIRSTGREPLNNEPFFRYAHMTQIDRVRDKLGFEQFMSGIAKVDELDQSQALGALAAFLRIAISTARQQRNNETRGSDVQGEEDAPAIGVSESQGVQFGPGGIQYNNWGAKPPLDPAELIQLSPYAAVARIQERPHSEVAGFFARAVAGDIAEIFAAFLEVDEAALVAALADVNRNKVTALIGPFADDYPRLTDLPGAAEAIARRAAELKWSHQPGTGMLQLAAQSPQRTDGYFRQYSQGCIFWRNNGGRACAVRGPIAECHLAGGGTGGKLGFPKDDGMIWHSGRVDGRGHEFEGGYLFSSSHGTYSLSVEFWNAWPRWLGFPLADAEAHDRYTSQRFEEGFLYSSQAGTFAVRSEVADLASDGWMPVSDEGDAGSRSTAKVQRFRRVNDTQTAVYSSKGTGTFRVTGCRLAFYEELGGPDSWLGLPVARAREFSGDSYAQAFEHGWVYSRAGSEVIAVPSETAKLAGDRLGWPVSQEQPIGDGADRIQFFEGGAVILREGKYAIWARPHQGEPQSAPGPAFRRDEPRQQEPPQKG